MTKRIVITGLGVLSPIGSGKDAFWRGICDGTVGTGPVRTFDTRLFDVHNGGEVKDANPLDYVTKLDPSSIGRTTHLAIAAAKMAQSDAGWTGEEYESWRVGVCFGTTMGNSSIIEDNTNLLVSEQRRASHSLWSNYPQHSISSSVAEELGLEGPSMVVPTACAAGNYAISWGKELIEDGLADAVIVGGSDAMSRACYTTFHRLGAIAPEICQPFDKGRKGMMVGEGAAALVLEDYERAAARGATIYAELLGYGLSCDAHHATAPHPEGLGAVLSMQRALQSAGVEPEQISYISAHGTGTKANDATESVAIRRMFGERADEVPISSIKAMMGHTMGAASAIEAVTCALAIAHGVLPPTMNYNEPDPECVSNVVPNAISRQPVRYALSNSFAFGGNISTILMGEAVS
ncbi:beta-ketoacyl-[acyl-carrier-protein] synthase family protein [Paenibacillus xylaniclasticus]|uniref:beta-ketoacyl-[acyl-carrier-protein] synthase family protein n=1 Tax=Paenibacillus xylaniclasticus TaxID=588083 RepID=UPI000FD97358|nr:MULTISPECIES: beta-ketoacyl-[acyl-carrier-protein] synthase family protein [Paenibacillus]GFN29928.1 beta-ketoacyl-[acyl-carrier-protein] synthase II [Paenibacillus curdlanolyticus]